MKRSSRRRIAIGRNGNVILMIAAVLLVTLSCSTTGDTTGLQLTKAALDVQSTMLAQQQAVQGNATTMAQQVQGTVLVQQATQLAMQATQMAQQQQQQPPPQPVVTQAPPQPQPQPAVTQAPPQPQPAVSEAPSDADVSAEIKNAKILLFEDMNGTGWYTYWQEALDMGGYNYKNDGSAEGWFKDDLLSGGPWDLIIAASESRTKIQGEYFVYLLTEINKGTGVIIEHWDIDDLSEGKVGPIMAKCGIDLYKDWWVSFADQLNLSVWAVRGDDPVFHKPNEGGMSLRNFGNFWNFSNDKGDLMKIVGGDAVGLMGTHAERKNDDLTLMKCLKGRLMFQTHSSHEYDKDGIERLMENMIYNTLYAHFTTKP